MPASTDTLHWYEKTALGLGMAAQSLVVTRWYLDDVAPPIVLLILLWVTVIVAVLAGIAFDAVMVVTTMGRREGRMSPWGWATALAASVFSAAVALHVYGGWSAGPWLHIGYPVITFLFAQHLAAPRKAKLSEVEQLTAWLEQERADAEQLRTDNEQAKQELEQEQRRAEQARADVGQLLSERDRKDQYIAQLQQLAERENIKAEQARAELEQVLSASDVNRRALVQAMSNAGMTDRQIAPLLSISTGTVSNWRKSSNGVEAVEGQG